METTQIADTKPSLASQWRERLTACAAIKAQEEAEQPTAEIELEGFRFRARRLPLQAWIRAGRLPAGLLRQMLSEKKQDSPVDAEALTPDEMIGSIAFQRDAVCFVMVEPKVVLHNHPAQDEVAYADLCQNAPEFIDALLQWVFSGSPGVPVKTEKGELSVDALNTFRQKQPGRTPVRVGTDESEVQPEAEPSAEAGG